MSHDDQNQAQEAARMITEGLAGIEDPAAIAEIRSAMVNNLPQEARWKLIAALMTDQERGDFIGMFSTFRRQNTVTDAAAKQIDGYLRYLRLG